MAKNTFRVVLLLAGTSLLGTSLGLAQPARVGGTLNPKPYDGGTRRFSSVSYDAANDAFLVAWGIGNVGVRYVGTDGALLGAPVNVNATTAGAARVACGSTANVCLVAWVQEPTSIIGRLLRYNGGAVAIVSAPFAISSNGKSKLTSAAPAVSYSPIANEFLVAWTEFSGTPGGPDLRGQRVSPNGAKVGTEIAIGATGYWEGMPSATYNSAQDEYIIGYYFETGSGADSLGLQRIKPGTGALVGGRSTIFSTFADLYPEISYNSRTNQYLAISWAATSPWMLHGWMADGNAQPLTPTPKSLAVQGGGDGVGLAYNPVSNTWLAVYLSQKNAEIWGVEIAANGTPGAQSQLTSTGTRLSTQPQAAGSATASRFYVTASDAFTKVMGQLVAHGTMGSSTPSCTTPQPAAGYTCVNGTWVAPAATSSCKTVQPASNWTCVNGNWLPPTTTTPPPPSGSCTTVQPAVGWTCVNGNWLPPTTTSGSCTTVKPASNWICVNGNWLPPTTTCTTVKPGTGWTCVNGNWLPPTTTSSSCTTVQPASNWTCVNGNWLPPTTTTSSCTTVKPGTGWTCVSGNWLPPTTAGSTSSSCTTVKPGADWTCVSGNWLPPGM